MENYSCPILRAFNCPIFIVVTLIWLSALSCVGQSPVGGEAHHTQNGFRNMQQYEENNFFDFIKWRWQRAWKEIPGPEDYNFPLAENDPDFLKKNRTKNTLTWIGHATVLLQVDGKNIITDPHFSNRTSPVQWAGPARVAPLGLPFEDLPPIDIVVISHDHYDALDEQTIMKLHQRPGGEDTEFFVPLGLKNWFENHDIWRGLWRLS